MALFLVPGFLKFVFAGPVASSCTSTFGVRNAVFTHRNSFLPVSLTENSQSEGVSYRCPGFKAPVAERPAIFAGPECFDSLAFNPLQSFPASACGNAKHNPVKRRIADDNLINRALKKSSSMRRQASQRSATSPLIPTAPRGHDGFARCRRAHFKRRDSRSARQTSRLSFRRRGNRFEVPAI